VDPIDGTRAYIAGQPDWAISAALVDGDRPIAACLYAPALDEFFAARAGTGSTLNGKPIAATPGAALGGIRVAGPQKFLDQVGARALAGAAACAGRAGRLRCCFCRRQ